MPRAKSDLEQPYFGVLSTIANFKSYSTDLIPDFKAILKIQRTRFKEFFLDEDLQKCSSQIEKLSKIKVKTTNESRVYIVTQLDVILFAMYNMDACVLDNMKCSLDLAEPEVPEYINPNFINTIFIFEKSDLAFKADISTKNAIEISIAFYKENLLNSGAFRDSWYGAPRRKERHESNQRH